MDIDLSQLRELMGALKEFDVSEIEIEQGEERITLRRGAAQVAQPQVFAPAASLAPAATTATATDDPSLTFITSPFVGTFYTAPSPDAAPFVTEGDKITKGQALCIVEAMKLMNEIEAEISGTLVSILAENGKPVEFGDRLFSVRKG